METRRSTTGFVISVNSSPVYWRSKRQAVIALSSAESEYVALSSCAKELSWIRKVYWKVCHQMPFNDGTMLPSTSIAMDSTAAQSLANNSQVSARNKHIALKVHHVRDLLKNGMIHLVHVPSSEQPADIITKDMPRETLTKMVSILHLRTFV